jgi:hypothetical protein
MLNALVLVSLTVVSAKQMELERIIMQLRSKVDSNRNEINSNIQDLTTQYLDDYFQAYYTQNQNKEGYFLETELTVTSLGVHGVDGSYITTLEMEGSLHFDPNNELPSKAFVDTLLRNAFQGRNERIYLNELLASSSQFLRYMTHIFIEIGDVTVTETEIERVGDDTLPVESNIGKNSTVADDSSSHGQQGHWLLEEEWAQITIYTAAGLLGLLLIIGSCCICKCLCCPGSRTVVVEDDENDLSDEPIKVVTLPVKHRDSRSTQGDNISPTSQETERSGSDSSSLEDQMGRSAPSPERSLASQSSSLFTYSNNNYASSKSSNMNVSRFSIGSFSRFSLDMPSIDLGGASVARSKTNPRGMQIPNFGHDISAIENHRDLSLIQEEDDDEELGHHHLARAQKKYGKRPTRHPQHYSSRRSFESKTYDTYDSGRSRSLSNGRSRHPSPSSHFFSRQRDDVDTSGYSIDLDASSGDVIADLRNLSLQIQKQRKNRRAPDPR